MKESRKLRNKLFNQHYSSYVSKKKKSHLYNNVTNLKQNIKKLLKNHEKNKELISYNDNKFLVKKSTRFRKMENLKKKISKKNLSEDKKIKSNSRLKKSNSVNKREKFGFKTGRNWMKKERMNEIGKKNFTLSGRKSRYGSQTYRKPSRKRKNSKNISSVEEYKKMSKRSNSFDQNAYVFF